MIIVKHFINWSEFYLFYRYFQKLVDFLYKKVYSKQVNISFNKKISSLQYLMKSFYVLLCIYIIMNKNQKNTMIGSIYVFFFSNP